MRFTPAFLAAVAKVVAAFAIGIATLPASLIFGALYQSLGPLAAFGFGAGLAVVAAVLLLGVQASSHAPTPS